MRNDGPSPRLVAFVGAILLILYLVFCAFPGKKALSGTGEDDPFNDTRD